MAKKTDDVVEDIVEETTEPKIDEAPQPTGAGLNLSDITSAVQIIDVCTKRGAFNGDELADVGAVRNRLQAFVIASTPKPEATT